MNTIESDSDSITSSEVSSGGNTDSDTSSRSHYGEDDDSIKSGGLHSLDNTDITYCLTKPRFLLGRQATAQHKLVLL